MSLKNKLKDFQWDTVSAVLDHFDHNSVYALADDVGLGKTRVCAEVAYQLVCKQRKKGPTVIYYVAPSIELIEQNLKAIEEYLNERFDGARVAVSLVSRLTKVALDISNRQNSFAKRGVKTPIVFLVGLSPETSFRLRGTGLKAERAYLAALFGYKLWGNSLGHLADRFFCIKESADSEFVREVRGMCSKERLYCLDIVRSHINFHEVRDALFTKTKSSPLSDVRELVKRARRIVAESWVSQSEAPIVILDEWHKYKDTCFSEDLMRRFIDQARSGGGASKLLLVSATPFSVRFEEAGGRTNISGQEEITNLLKLYFGPDSYSEASNSLTVSQKAFFEATESLLANPTSEVEKSLSKAKREYENILKKYCVRTERKHYFHDSLDKSVSESVGDKKNTRSVGSWGDSEFESLSSFLSSFSSRRDIRSPVLSMWQDGHTFPKFRDYAIYQKRIDEIRGDHWKLNKLRSWISAQYLANDLHSSNMPPLWINPFSPVKKALIFSEFQFVTREVCEKSYYGRPRKYSHRAPKVKLGYFPLEKLRKRNIKVSAEAVLEKNFHWVLFYPALRYEDGVDIPLPTDENSDSLLHQTLINLDGSESSNSKERLKYRSQMFSKSSGIPVKRTSKEYFNILANQSIYPSLGKHLVNGLKAGGVWDLLKGKSLEYWQRFDDELMAASNELLHLFSSDEASRMAIEARKRGLIPKELKKLHPSIGFAIWYSKEYFLNETIAAYAKLLLDSGFDPIKVLQEITATINLRKSKVGSKWIRMFQDSQEQDKEKDHVVDKKTVRRAFNSPFPPYVLVTTSVGQEGLDFHRYCSEIFHWSPPSSPNSLRQREGRLDRFQSKQIRDALNKYPMSQEGDRGLSPDFVVLGKDGERLNRPQSHVLFLPFSSQEKNWHRCLERAYYNDLLIGAPDPGGAERKILLFLEGLSEKERRRRLSILNRYSVSLRPSFISTDRKKFLLNVKPK